MNTVQWKSRTQPGERHDLWRQSDRRHGGDGCSVLIFMGLRPTPNVTRGQKTDFSDCNSDSQLHITDEGGS